jgi:hypothetical protein
MMPFADHLAYRACSWTIDEQRTVQVWRRHDGKYRVVELHRIGDSGRYREARGQTCDDYASAHAAGMRWVNEAGQAQP